MTPEQWRRLKPVLQSALELPAERRDAFLQHRCPDDSLRAEVRSLIAAYESDPALGESPAAAILADEEEATATIEWPDVGPYQVIGRLGAGGMGQVYLAVDPRLKRKVAVKLLPPELTNDADRVRRLAQEARSASALNHPNIVTIYELGQIDSTHYIVQEYLEGETLRERLARGPVKSAEATEIARQVASALSAAHEAGVVHRDIKPENIMLRRDGLVKVLDFGLAKVVGNQSQVHTGAGMILGTGFYMSPEQARGEQVDGRTDVWSLGIVLYEMLSGRRPFDGSTVTDTLSLIIRAEPQRLTGVPAPLQRILLKSLRKDRDQRYGDAGQMLSDLQSVPHTRKIPWITAAAATGATALMVTLLVLRPWRESAVAPVSPPAAKSVAVLPFANLSGSADNEHLSDGITDEMISALAKLPNLKVVSRTSAFAVKGKTGDVREIAAKLGVDTVVEGSVRRAGNRLRVSAQLVNARDGYHMWSDTYDREITDIFSIQDEIATAVAGALRVRLGGQRVAAGPRTNDFEAYEAYLRGRQVSTYWSRDSMEKATVYFRMAIDRDPSFSKAWAGLADAYAMMDHRPGTSTRPPEEEYRLAATAADRALALDPESAEAHAALGHIYMHQGRFPDAERHLRRALELNPGSAMAHLWYAMYLRTQRRIQEAKPHFRQAQDIDPYSMLTALLGGTLWTYGEAEAALEATQRGLQVAPESGELHLTMARIHAYRGNFAEAHTALQRAATAADPSGIVEEERAVILALQGRREEARALLERLEREKKNAYLFPIMRAWAVVGDLDKAAEMLDRYVKRSPDRARLAIDLPVHPAFRAFNTDPRYVKVRRDLGLPPPTLLR